MYKNTMANREKRRGGERRGGWMRLEKRMESFFNLLPRVPAVSPERKRERDRQKDKVSKRTKDGLLIYF